MAAVVAMSGCSSKEAAKGSKLDLSAAEAEAAAVVTSDTISDKTFTFGDREVDATEVARIYGQAGPDIYLSVRAYGLKEYPAVNNWIAQTVDGKLAEITESTFADTTVTTIPELTASLDAAGAVFADSIAPAMAASVAPYYNIVINMQPAYATDSYMTYATYVGSYTGGANGYYEYYYSTFDPVTADVFDFAQIVKPEKQADIRKALVETIAESQSLSTDDYLRQLNEFLMTDESSRITTENFPIYNVGVTADGLVFSYPKYSIAPGSDGAQSYVLPEGVTDGALAI